jgi:GT2 family glycosyltransferase
MVFSVIIPALNASRHLNAIFNALSGQTFKDVEYIFVDNGSKDRSMEMIQNLASQYPDLNIKILQEEKSGASAARNRGAFIAQGDWLVFTDADCIPDSGWLQDYFEARPSSNEIGAIAGCIKPGPSQNFIAKFLGLFTLPANVQERYFNEFTLVEGGFPAANLAIRKEVFKKVGGFEEAIRIYGEDYDLCARIYGAGYKIKTTTGAVVHHSHRNDLQGLVKQSFAFGKSHALNLKQNVPGALIWSGPAFSKTSIRKGCRIWVDVNQADKKFVFTILLGYAWWPLWILPPAYIVYLGASICRRERSLKVSARLYYGPIMTVLCI